MTSFKDFQIGEDIIKSLSNMGFENPTPIQEKAIPVALEGRDMIGQAQTGTGKTTAFGVPMIDKITLDQSKVQGLVIAPTRELAIQVGEELNRIGQHKRVRTVPVYGGQDIQRQIKALKKHPQIVVATPGRLLDHIRRRTIRLDEIQTVVLDEADEMLNMGFIEDIEAILAEIPSEYQTLLFSATMPQRIQRLAERFMDQPEVIRIKAKQLTVENIEQFYLEVKEPQKFDVLCKLLDIESPDLAIIFGRTKKRVDELTEGLLKRGYSAEGIHGDITQNKRERAIKRFKNQTTDILVATDVAARGLDISGVTHVYNFDLPQDPESYVHRIGRTGRAGNKGQAVTFVVPREFEHLKNIEELTKHKMTRKQIPSYDDVLEGIQKATRDDLLNALEDQDFQKYKRVAENLLDEYHSVDVVAAALKLLAKEPDRTPVKLSAVSPLRVKKVRQGKGGGNRKRHNNRRGGGQNRNRGGGRRRDDRRPNNRGNRGNRKRRNPNQ
ncbi:DEAD/DEAH box helicase [Tenuibacillus multivorans]|uniref:DEAD-box ATP-dependent RNA helicase CshA n=1 Tax=Tenuibacillus multivorans TaxID=237069 RepID=A0A1H0B676_9BACI|nr:DEAD/DEAH box helicase [Tenuibacillus multivorans]GEL78627.1 DEAD-box ATP-dependent RNA helicase CshA [Tenuibacillus multivorans]SDN41170.1 ATP-dependent RNA helicase DeaD [Tenuibacillus multivorans]